MTKIGSGTLTLSGANTYSGDTTIKAGRIVSTTASTGAGNFSVSNSATMGVTVATAGSTLNVNNLLFGTSSLQLNGGTNGNPTAAILHVNGALIMNGTVTVSLSGVGLTAGGPFTVMTYNPGSRLGAGTFSLVNSPRIVATLNDDTANGIVSITITSADSAVKWNGGTDGNWDISNSANTIWQTVPSGSTTFYIESGSGNDVALFNDTLTGTSNVTLTTTLSPQAITVSNSTVNYLFTGSGRLSGTTGLTKQGSGTLTIGNSGNNDFSGNISLAAGTLVISNTSLIGNSISGSGALTKNGNGTLTLNGDNSAFTGPVAVNGGILKVLSTASLATASATTIASGGALDIGLNTVALGQQPITASGSGPDGNGAIINSSGNATFSQANFQKLTLAGNTTIGGPGRLDLRSTDATLGTDATLSTGGNAYKLTKISGNQFQMAGVQVDSALGDIEVQAGILGIQGQISSLGETSSHSLTVFNGATFQLFAVANTITKPLILKDGAIVNNNNGANTYGGAVNLQGNALFNIAGTSATFTNVLSGTGGIAKVTGTAPMTLTVSNTYSGDTVVGAGTLALSGDGAIRQSANISVAGTLDVTARTDGTLTLGSGHSLSGAGTLSGILNALAGSTVSPGGNGNSALTVSGDATLAGTTLVRLNGGAVTSDRLAVGGTVNYGGTLVLTNISGALAAGQSFQLFTAGTFNGSFATIQPSSPGYGLSWNTNALNTGLLSIDGALSITNFSISGSTVTMQGLNGTPNGPYALLSSTNVSLPLSQWTSLVTNSFDGSGFFSLVTNFDNSLPRQFFIIRSP